MREPDRGQENPRGSRPGVEVDKIIRIILPSLGPMSPYLYELVS